jgi:hypothetical protein
MFSPTDVHSRRFPQKAEKGKVDVVMLLPDSHERLDFEKPTRSVPETWGRMYDVLELRN